MQAAREQGVTGLIVPSTCPDDWAIVQNMCRLPEIRALALGVHPWFVAKVQMETWVKLQQHLHAHSALWVGEIGLDKLYANQQSEMHFTQQVSVFETQLALAQQAQRPIILHNVKATQSILISMARTRFTQGGIAHAFSGSLDEAQALMARGFKIGLGSLLLNPHAKKVRILAEKLPENSILLETDSPYMLPENRNTPSHLRLIAEEVARLRQIDLVQLAQICEKNLQELLA